MTGVDGAAGVAGAARRRVAGVAGVAGAARRRVAGVAGVEGVALLEATNFCSPRPCP